jgi:hypothetical protein
MIGNTANFLLKVKKAGSGQLDSISTWRPSVIDRTNEIGTDASISPKEEARFKFSQPGAPTSLEGTRSSVISLFSSNPSIEVSQESKEITNVEIPFNRTEYGDKCVLRWEYICHSDQPPYFGINYIPDSLEMSPIVKLLPFISSGSRVIFPLSNVQSYSRPAYGTIPVSDFKSGRFIFTWDNSIAFSKRTPKSFTYKIMIENSESQTSLHCQIDIHRKSSIILPVINPSEEPVFLHLEYFSGGTNIPFSMYVDSTPKIVKLPDMMGLPQPLIPQKQQRKTLVNFNKTLAKNNGHHIIEKAALNGSGVVCCVFDNTQSVLSTRHVEIHLMFIHQ